MLIQALIIKLPCNSFAKKVVAVPVYKIIDGGECVTRN